MVKLVELSELRTAKDGRNFFVAGFRAGFGQRAVKRTFWEQFKKDADGNNTEEKYWERASYKEALELLKTGEIIDARRVTHTVEPYAISDNMVNQYSTVVFPDENEVVVFSNQNHPIVDQETGEVLGKKKQKPVVTVEVTTEQEA